MSDPTPPAADQPHNYPPPPPPPPPAFGQGAAVAAPTYAGVGLPSAAGPTGRIRSTGVCMLLFVVTLGIYGWFWYYNVHEEMKRHTGDGIGGAVGLILGIFVSIVMAFLTPYEVGRLYARRGQPEPVSALTGLWGTLGTLILVGPIVWFVKTNGALNSYWRSVGVQG
ncbi:DUF4234 domain-containing protein [Nocardioides terrisoli]|uniref:DUF4234 domain-containing protein n=1 Tax=Nocardioides terrisoli TaxID=3388267 RepID=UPI00287B68A8|nr:DUF4234 domain-containing protein [Nocardioides marmorisolisilvae]